MTPEERRDWRCAVFGDAELTPAHKLVLLALETFADYGDGTDARPGVARLAEMCGLKTRVVEAALQLGVKRKFIAQTDRANPKRRLAACYRLVSTRTSMRVDAPNNDVFNPHESAFLPARSDVSNRTYMRPTSSVTPIENTDISTRISVRVESAPTYRTADDVHNAIAGCPDCDDYGRLDDLSDCPKHGNFRQYPGLAAKKRRKKS